MATRMRHAVRSLLVSWKSCVTSYSTHVPSSVAQPASAPVRDCARNWARSWKGLLGDINKLSMIVMTTSAAGFVLGSGEAIDWAKLAWTCVGTWSCSAAANTCNQIYEIHNDSLMRRTMLRPLPAGRLSVVAALGFAAVTGLAGAFILQTKVSCNGAIVA
jgi:hypothetical protein